MSSDIRVPLYHALDVFGLSDILNDSILFTMSSMCKQMPVIFGGVATQIARGLPIESDQDLDIMIPPLIIPETMGFLDHYIKIYMRVHNYYKVESKKSIEYDSKHMRKHISDVITYCQGPSALTPRRRVQFVFLKEGKTVEEAISEADLSCTQAWIEGTCLRSINDKILNDIRAGIGYILWDTKDMSDRENWYYGQRIWKYLDRGFKIRGRPWSHKTIIPCDPTHIALFVDDCRLRSNIPSDMKVEDLVDTAQRKIVAIDDIFEAKADILQVVVEYNYNPCSDIAETIKFLEIKPEVL